jgi:hypothetical protein
MRRGATLPPVGCVFLKLEMRPPRPARRASTWRLRVVRERGARRTYLIERVRPA